MAVQKLAITANKIAFSITEPNTPSASVIPSESPGSADLDSVRRPGPLPWPQWRAALLGSATGISWGFVAAVIKELSSHTDDGIGAVFTNWSLYVLLVAGAATMLLASHALAAGPLAASQPGFTVLDPLSAGLLGVFLFNEHIKTGVLDLTGEALALAVVIGGASILSHSRLILGEDEKSPVRCMPSGWRPPAGGKRLELDYQAANARSGQGRPESPPGDTPTSESVSRGSGPPVR